MSCGSYSQAARTLKRRGQVRHLFAAQGKFAKSGEFPFGFRANISRRFGG